VTRKKQSPDDSPLRPYASSPCQLHELDPSYQERSFKDDWAAIRHWRRQQRQRLIERRRRLDSSERNHAATVVIAVLENEPGIVGRDMAFYWPLDGEVDLRPLMQKWLDRNNAVSLPVIVNRARPLEFWEWNERTRMRRGAVWDIPVPDERNVASPSVLLVPLVGFDEQGHRLGHGGGYYDRTLAKYVHRCVAVGVGYEFGRMKSIYPQDHDMPMDAIVTEKGIDWYVR